MFTLNIFHTRVVKKKILARLFQNMNLTGLTGNDEHEVTRNAHQDDQSAEKRQR